MWIVCSHSLQLGCLGGSCYIWALRVNCLAKCCRRTLAVEVGVVEAFRRLEDVIPMAASADSRRSGQILPSGPCYSRRASITRVSTRDATSRTSIYNNTIVRTYTKN